MQETMICTPDTLLIYLKKVISKPRLLGKKFKTRFYFILSFIYNKVHYHFKGQHHDRH